MFPMSSYSNFAVWEPKTLVSRDSSSCTSLMLPAAGLTHSCFSRRPAKSYRVSPLPNPAPEESPSSVGTRSATRNATKVARRGIIPAPGKARRDASTRWSGGCQEEKVRCERTEHAWAGRLSVWALSPLSYLAARSAHPDVHRARIGSCRLALMVGVGRFRARGSTSAPCSSRSIPARCPGGDRGPARTAKRRLA